LQKQNVTVTSSLHHQPSHILPTRH